jgi:hypothetical protein
VALGAAQARGDYRLEVLALGIDGGARVMDAVVFWPAASV